MISVVKPNGLAKRVRWSTSNAYGHEPPNVGFSELNGGSKFINRILKIFLLISESELLLAVEKYE
jgi:hypothetical protein